MHEHRLRPLLSVFAACAAVFLAGAASAQSLSGVSGAEVKAGDDSVEYRAGFAAAGDGRPEGFAHRFHYQHAFDGHWRARLLVTQSKRGGEALQTRSVGLEILHQFLESERTGGWDSAVRLDGQIPVGGGPGRARIAWLNSVDLDKQWQLRGNLYFNRSFGDAAPEGMSIETREEATYNLPSGIRVGVQMLNYFNTTAAFGSFDDQRHQLGPVVKGKIGKHVKYEASALFGLSRAASDADFRLFLGYEF